MAVIDSHCNAPTDRCREEENPETLASPEQGSEKKKKKRKHKNKETNEQPQDEVCAKPFVDTVIPIVPQEDKAETTTQNPNPTPKKKKKKKKKNALDEHQLQTCDPSNSIGVGPDGTKEEGAHQGDANGNGGLCPEHEPPVPDPTPPNDTPRKKKKKNVLKHQPKESSNTEHPQQSSPEPKNKMKKRGEANAEQSRLYPKSELAPPLDIAIPCDFELKKRAEPIEAKVEHPQACYEAELAFPIDLPTPMNLEKKKEAESSEAHAQHPQPSSKYKRAIPEINDPAPPEDTPRKKKSTRKKKKGVEPEPEPEPELKEFNNTEHPQQCSPDSELKIKMKIGAKANAEHSQVCSKPELALPLIPNDSEVEKRAEPTGANEEHPQACSKPELASPIDPGRRKEVEPSKERAQPPQPQPCSEPNAEPLGDPTTPVDQSRRKRKNKRGREKIMSSDEKVENQRSPLHMDIALNQAPNQVQPEPAIPICLQPASLTDQTISVDPAIPVDTEQKTEKKKRNKQRKNALEGEEPNDIKHSTEQPEIPIQTSTCLVEASPIDPAIPMDPCLAIPLCPAISTDPEQEMSEKKRKKKRKSARNSEVAGSNEHNGKLPEAPPEAPVQKSIYPIAAPSIDPPKILIGRAPPIDTANPIVQGQEMTKKKRKKKRSELISEGAEPNETDGKPPETPVQRFVYPIVAPSIDPTIPVPASPIDPTIPVPASPIDPTIPVQASPIDQGQKMSKKKRKRKKSALISEGEEPNEHDGKPPGTPVQRSIYPIAAPSIDSTIPAGQAPPVDPQQMNKEKRKKRKSALESEGLESEKHNADPTAETPVQRSIYPIAAPSIDLTIPTDQAPPVDPEQMNKKKRKKRKSALESEGLESEKHNADPTVETPVQRSIYPVAASSIDSTIPTDQAPPVDPATPVDAEQMNKKKRKKRKSALESEGLESEKHNADPTAETPVKRSIYPIAASSIDSTIPTDQAPPLDPAIPVDPEQMNKKKRKKRKSALESEGLESEKHNTDPTAEIPVQRSIYPIAAPSIDSTILTDQAPPVYPATPVDPEQMKKKKRKKRKSALESEGLEYEKHNADSTVETPVQSSIYPMAASSMDSTIPTDQALPAAPVDPEQMNEKKRKKRKSALESEGLESEKHNTDPTAETPVQKTEGPITENSMGRCNAEPVAKILAQGADSLRVTKSPFKQHGDSSVICRACRQLGHTFQQCQRLKCLSMDEEVCFFCGEIGHSLGKCCVSRAGGGRFAKCLFCYEHGHFSYNCPQNGHGIDPEGVAANGAINRTAVEAKGKSLVEV